MGIVQKFALTFIGNGLALYLAALYIPGVSIPLSLPKFALVVAVLTLINLFIRPIIKLALTPLIFLTLGLGFIAVNVLTLYLLDFLLTTVTINGFPPLIFTTLLVSAVNLVISYSAKLI